MTHYLLDSDLVAIATEGEIERLEREAESEMGNEPNEAEMKIADEILALDFRAFAPHAKDHFDTYSIAAILAAHRADESELAKALGRLLDAIEMYHETPEIIEAANAGRAALATHGAGKGA